MFKSPFRIFDSFPTENRLVYQQHEAAPSAPEDDAKALPEPVKSPDEPVDVVKAARDAARRLARTPEPDVARFFETQSVTNRMGMLQTRFFNALPNQRAAKQVLDEAALEARTLAMKDKKRMVRACGLKKQGIDETTQGPVDDPDAPFVAAYLHQLVIHDPDDMSATSRAIAVMVTHAIYGSRPTPPDDQSDTQTRVATRGRGP